MLPYFEHEVMRSLFLLRLLQIYALINILPLTTTVSFQGEIIQLVMNTSEVRPCHSFIHSISTVNDKGFH